MISLNLVFVAFHLWDNGAIDQRVINSCAPFGRNFSTDGIFKNVVGKELYISCQYSACSCGIEMSYWNGEIKSDQKAVRNDG